MNMVKVFIVNSIEMRAKGALYFVISLQKKNSLAEIGSFLLLHDKINKLCLRREPT